uniref:Uncharacterized protein n=1 Tax=Romanomermis culicivorax TaxID=13658 RepID=A0A915L5V9_ROMCU
MITIINFGEESEDHPAATDEPYELKRGAFKCPEEGCIKTFVLHHNLLMDLTLGNHKLMPQSGLITPQHIIGFWAREVNHQWEDRTTFVSSNLKGECNVEDEEEPYKDPAMFDPHLEYESELLKADCFK